MFDSLLEQIPASFAIVLLILMVSFNFFFGLIRLIYLYYSKKEERSLVDEIKEMNKIAMDRIGDIEKTANDATAQIAVMLAHYDSEVKFRNMLEDKVNTIEKKIDGNGHNSMETEIQLIKQKLELMSEQKDSKKGK